MSAAAPGAPSPSLHGVGLLTEPSASRPGRDPSPPRVLALGPRPVRPAPRRHRRRVTVRGLLVLTDLLVLLAPAALLPRHALPLVGTAVVAVLLYQQAGLYRSRLHLSVLDEVPALVGRAAVAAAVTALLVPDVPGAATRQIVLAVAAGVAGVLVARSAAYGLLRAARRRGITSARTLLLGGGQVAADLAATLLDHPEYGLLPVGYVDARLAGPTAVPYLGSPAALRRLVAEHDVGVLLAAPGAAGEAELAALLRDPAVSGCELVVVPRLSDAVANPGGDHIGAVPVERRRAAHLQGPAWALKRAFDVVLAAGGLVLLAPVLLACALAVRLEGGAGVVFRQPRVGRGGRVFDVLKFRSLRPASEAESASTWTVAGDARIGPVGRVLRKTSLDELPQLWNILRGDMTVVGPRPERPHFVNRFAGEVPQYADRHRVPAGLTGLAQVSGLRGDTSIRDRARYDNYYIENWSLWLDVKVMVRTLREVLFARGA